ncbi:hypothetical protein Q8F55_008141 [Vanrija albida]|uniref:SAP domain-containing protein n=1 Tax=Vanrija albida TaxID=181172 RepID=A0ABR3PVR6_9TREE
MTTTAATTTDEVPSDPPQPATAAAAAAPDPEPAPALERPRKKATASEMRASLELLGLDTRGKRETLWKRLFAAFTRAKEDSDAAAAAAAAESAHAAPPKQPYGSFLCFDVEATCEAGKNFDYPNEIIEFPVVLLRWEPRDDGARSCLVTVDTFHTYVRPTWRPVLSDFCSSLTGIGQEVIDAAPTFPEVLARLEAWLDGHGLRDGDALADAVWVTDGPWDLRDFIPKQLHITPTSPPRYPAYLLGPYLNIKAGVHAVLSEAARREAEGPVGRHTLPRLTTAMRRPPQAAGGPNFYLTIPGQLAALGLGVFAGRQHSGIDDATNIARILAELAARHVVLEPNARLPPARAAKTWPWMGGPGEVVWASPAAPVLGAAASAAKAAKPSEDATLADTGAEANGTLAPAADRTADIAGLMDSLSLGAKPATDADGPKPNL